MRASDIFIKIAITIFIIAATVALFMIATNAWETKVLTTHINVFYFFGFFFVVCIALALISGLWEK